MKKSKLSIREILMIVILSVILLGTVYYLFFYFPHNAEMYNLVIQVIHFCVMREIEEQIINRT